jgi:predicted transcriptional regulator YdeE
MNIKTTEERMQTNISKMWALNKLKVFELRPMHNSSLNSLGFDHYLPDLGNFG